MSKNKAQHELATSHKKDADQPGEKKDQFIDKTLSTTANLAKLLPTGTTLAFQALAPSFTNHGNCYPVNRYLSWGLIAFTGGICVLLSFSDSMNDDDGHPYYGLAVTRKRGGFIPFNQNGSKNFNQEERLKRSVRMRDWVHAVLRALVFLAVAFSDSGVQSCLIPREKPQWKEFLVNMPLGMGFLASFVFMIFPSTRKGIGYGDDSPAAGDKSNASAAATGQASPAGDRSNASAAATGQASPPGDAGAESSRGGAANSATATPTPTGSLLKSSLQMRDGARVAHSASCHYELDSVV